MREASCFTPFCGRLHSSRTRPSCTALSRASIWQAMLMLKRRRSFQRTHGQSLCSSLLRAWWLVTAATRAGQCAQAAPNPSALQLSFKVLGKCVLQPVLTQGVAQLLIYHIFKNVQFRSVSVKTRLFSFHLIFEKASPWRLRRCV